MADPQITNEKSSVPVTDSGSEVGKVAIATEIGPNGTLETEVDSDNAIIITGADVAAHLLPLRDDFEPALTFRSVFLATILASFQAVMSQIYVFKPTRVAITGTFIVLVAYFIGSAWAAVLPRDDKLEAKWRAKGNTGKTPRWIKVASFFNHGPWNLKEHSICAITATSASNAKESIQVFAAQDLFYDMPLSAVTVVLSSLSIGLFGYGLCGMFREFAVYHVDAVYWGTLPTVKTLQALHWEVVKDSKPMRWFWYSFGAMFLYEFLPAYTWPWLNSVSIPCLAAMHATGNAASILNNLFGGSLNNQGLGLFSISLDWQYLTSFHTSLPLVLQWHMLTGFATCMVIMLAIYYGNWWDAKSHPFMSTRIRKAGGGMYPISKIFPAGKFDAEAFGEYGVPELTGTFAYALFMANAAIGALVTHCFVFWGKDIWTAYKNARKGIFNDRHHDHMVEHYKETPWWWFIILLVVSFVLGLVVVIKSDITLPAWAYIVALLLGCFISPLSTLLFSRFGNGIATNNLSKMLAGLLLPERPVGNMYFAAWSHSVIHSTVNLSNDLKMGEYLKIPPREMFLTQVYGTIIGGFVNYAVMVSIVSGKKDMLVKTDGSNAWSGATMQAFNTNASSWALAKYLYTGDGKYSLVPIGIAVGAALVIVHRIFVHFVPKIRFFSTSDINMPQFIQYAGYIPYNQSQTCIILTMLIAGFYVQYYLRNYKPRIFKDYSYLVTGAFDGASLLCLFILSFSVFGAGGKPKPFPKWWGNNVGGNLDLCPTGE